MITNLFLSYFVHQHGHSLVAHILWIIYDGSFAAGIGAQGRMTRHCADLT
jgi:hypothetical protein